jgi:hypothetical protein
MIPTLFSENRDKEIDKLLFLCYKHLLRKLKDKSSYTLIDQYQVGLFALSSSTSSKSIKSIMCFARLDYRLK